VLIDKREIANGSTSATTSMLQYEIEVPLYELIDMIGEEGAVASYKACAATIDKLAEISTQINSKSGLKKNVSLCFAAYKKDIAWLKKEYEARKKAGFNVKWLEPEQIYKKYDLQHSQGGILSDQGASVDAFRLAHDILAFNIKRGLRVFDKTELEVVKYHSRS